jgi:hypothetical protein
MLVTMGNEGSKMPPEVIQKNYQNQTKDFNIIARKFELT